MSNKLPHCPGAVGISMRTFSDGKEYAIERVLSTDEIQRGGSELLGRVARRLYDDLDHMVRETKAAPNAPLNAGTHTPSGVYFPAGA